MTQAALEQQVLVFQASSSPKEHKGLIWDPGLAPEGSWDFVLSSALTSQTPQQGADGRFNTLSP